MARKTALMLGLVAMSLAAPAVHAQAQPAPAPAPAATVQPAANPVDPGAIQALKDLGAHLQSLKRFAVSTELVGERVLADGQKLQHMAKAQLRAERPNKLRVRMWNARNERELFFNGKTVTLYTPAQKYYSTVELVDTVGGLVGKLEEKYGIQIPLSDLFVWGTPAAPIDKIESAMNAGQDFVNEDLCDHYAFRQGQIDWQIWISVGKNPLPRKIVIVNRADESRPQSVSLLDWNLKPVFSDSTFRFTPPKGATRVEVVPLKSK